MPGLAPRRSGARLPVERLGVTWQVSSTPIRCDKPSAGIFSIAFRMHSMALLSVVTMRARAMPAITQRSRQTAVAHGIL
jgi:hypothetical protein